MSLTSFVHGDFAAKSPFNKSFSLFADLYVYDTLKLTHHNK
jgi:hypothetical protein